jgi:hypothetical protein
MHFILCALWVFVIIRQPASCFYNLCHTPKNTALSSDECSELYFGPSEKETNLGHIKLEWGQDALKVTPTASSWTNSFLRISSKNNKTNQFCSKLSAEKTPNFYCISIKPETENETFLLEYKVEKLPEISTRQLLFSIHNWTELPLFPYIDLTDTSCLVLKAQKLTPANITYYKVEAYKEKNGNTNLQDLQLFTFEDEIFYELYTYNDEGNYYFVISVLSNSCSDNLCLKISTPKVYIGRKSTRVVIGIVGASFILPFVLFIFHVLTKTYPADENQSEYENRLVIAYKSSFKKHNDVVFALASLLEKLILNRVDVVDLSKKNRKFLEKSCIDSVVLAKYVVYVAPPRHDSNPILVDKWMSEKQFVAVIFDHCIDKLPDFFDNHKTFKLFEEFDKFICALNISETHNPALEEDLRKKTAEAKIETDRYTNVDVLPKIIVTDSEPQEHDSLISTKVVL